MPQVKNSVTKAFQSGCSIDQNVGKLCLKSVVATILRFTSPLDTFYSESRRPLCVDEMQINTQATVISSEISGNVVVGKIFRAQQLSRV